MKITSRPRCVPQRACDVVYVRVVVAAELRRRRVAQCVFTLRSRRRQWESGKRVRERLRGDDVNARRYVGRSFRGSGESFVIASSTPSMHPVSTRTASIAQLRSDPGKAESDLRKDTRNLSNGFQRRCYNM